MSAVLVLCSSIIIIGLHFIWVPDIWRQSENVVGEKVTGDGYRITVKQVWNKIDFYSTYLSSLDPEGKATVYLLDGDDIKRWNCQFSVDGINGSITVDMGIKANWNLDYRRKICK